MKPCSQFEEDVALLAGGDLTDDAAARAHLAGCRPCRELLADLSAGTSLASAGGAAIQAECEALASGELADAVLAQLAASGRARVGTTSGGRVRPTSVGSASLWRGVAAAAVLVTGGLALLLVTRQADAPAVPRAAVEATVAPVVSPPAPPFASAPSAPPPSTASLAAASMVERAVEAPSPRAPKPAVASPPVFLRHVAGRSVEVSWTPDGRERSASRTPYRVLASASPDFTDAKPIEVHGQQLIASAALPALRSQGRALTFFRVE